MRLWCPLNCLQSLSMNASSLQSIEWIAEGSIWYPLSWIFCKTFLRLISIVPPCILLLSSLNNSTTSNSSCFTNLHISCHSSWRSAIISAEWTVFIWLYIKSDASPVTGCAIKPFSEPTFFHGNPLVDGFMPDLWPDCCLPVPERQHLPIFWE